MAPQRSYKLQGQGTRKGWGKSANNANNHQPKQHCSNCDRKANANFNCNVQARKRLPDGNMWLAKIPAFTTSCYLPTEYKGTNFSLARRHGESFANVLFCYNSSNSGELQDSGYVKGFEDACMLKTLLTRSMSLVLYNKGWAETSLLW